MVIPPPFSDLGKQASDLFSKGYNPGHIKIEHKAKTANGVEFKTTGISQNDTKTVTGNLESKFCIKDYGLTITENWSTDNLLNGKFEFADKIAEGLKLTLDTKFNISSGKKSAKVKGDYKRDYINLNTETDFDYSAQSVMVSCVGMYEGWLGGVQGSYDFTKSRLAKYVLAIGYKGSDFELNTYVKDGKDFGGSIYHAVRKGLEAGVQCSWVAGTNSSCLAIASKYVIDDDSHLKAKVNSNSSIGLGYTHQLNKGVKVTLSTIIDGKALSGGDHKVGLGVELGN